MMPSNSPTRARIPIWQRIEGGAWFGVGVLCLVIWGLISLGAGEFTYPWPLWVAGKLRPFTYRQFRLTEAADAHRLMESSQHIGKILLVP